MVVQVGCRASLWLCTLLLTTTTIVSGAIVEYDFVLGSKLDNRYSPDCQHLESQQRSLFLAGAEGSESNAIFPGPTIEAQEGDTIKLRVTNHHPTTGATIHFHGIHQLGTPWADGAVQVTQCSLSPWQRQVYEFEAYPSGTHYWHAHHGMDVADGLTGPLIVRPKDPEPFEYDEEQIVFLQDFYIHTGAQQKAGLENYVRIARVAVVLFYIMICSSITL